MSSYVVDANVVFSALISGKEKYQQNFVTNTFYFPDFGLIEIQKYQSLILQKTHLPPEKLRNFTLRFFANIVVIPNFLISTQSYFQAFQLCKSIDEKDTPYVALSIEFDIKLISKDVELIQGLRQKGYSNVLTLSEFFEQIDKS